MSSKTAGIYLHIPFCKQACYYCNFHFSTGRRFQKELVEALKQELVLRKNYLSNLTVETIYFGGGSPSLLSVDEVKALLTQIKNLFPLASEMEITLEANPDDLSLPYLTQIRETGVNRLSIGIQSFDNEVLASLNRAHNAEEAVASISHAREAGFANFSIDLMYGLPARKEGGWEKELKIALGLTPDHISAYCLTIEPNTVFGHRRAKGIFTPVSEEEEIKQFQTLKEELHREGYVHYEISNFCKAPYYAKHNTRYWQRVPYLGIGPSAHSYNGKSRQYNIAHNKAYINAITEGSIPCRQEILTAADHINEYIMLGLRTMWGCDTEYLRQHHGHDLLTIRKKEVCLAKQEKMLIQKDNTLLLTPKGQLIADEIAKTLFCEIRD